MWTIFLGLCALACPLSMAAMVLMMRRGRRGDPTSAGPRATQHGPERSGDE